ncbi:inner membrane protein yaah [Anaeramoeba flamelloides]|uniref:Inner membrane protein yaah n=1 Tax=Anaeramoeba flamelloides TaxID=1746091 RepID=A0ABQ8XPY3_9EUKA|nr:inner membrane protein yaah [Anaeramoeba flamelloides]
MSSSSSEMVPNYEDFVEHDNSNSPHLIIPTPTVEIPSVTSLSILSKPKTLADPSVVGICALGIGCLMFAFSHFGITPKSNSLKIPWIIFLMGFVMFISSLVDAFRKNIFGFTVFLMYSMFWVALGFSQYFVQLANSKDLEGGQKHMAMAFIGYFIFNVGPMIISMYLNKALFVIMALLQILLLCVSLQFLNVLSPVVASPVFLLISIVSFYYCLATLVNDIGGDIILPYGSPIKKITTPITRKLLPTEDIKKTDNDEVEDKSDHKIHIGNNTSTDDELEM